MKSIHRKIGFWIISLFFVLRVFPFLIAIFKTANVFLDHGQKLENAAASYLPFYVKYVNRDSAYLDGMGAVNYGSFLSILFDSFRIIGTQGLAIFVIFLVYWYITRNAVKINLKP